MSTMRFLTEKDVATITKLSLSKLRQDRFKQRGIPFYKVGKSIRYSAEDVLSFMHQHKITPTT